MRFSILRAQALPSAQLETATHTSLVIVLPALMSTVLGCSSPGVNCLFKTGTVSSAIISSHNQAQNPESPPEPAVPALPTSGLSGDESAEDALPNCLPDDDPEGSEWAHIASASPPALALSKPEE
jgi:hypothetical protein